MASQGTRLSSQKLLATPFAQCLKHVWLDAKSRCTGRALVLCFFTCLMIAHVDVSVSVLRLRERLSIPGRPQILPWSRHEQLPPAKLAFGMSAFICHSLAQSRLTFWFSCVGPYLVEVPKG